MTGDAIVAKISTDGGAMLYASYLGGGCGEFGSGIAVNDDGTAWVVGSTFSPDFPVTRDALQPVFGGGFGDGFLVRVSAAGDRLTYSTYLGGDDYDQVNAIVRDIEGNLYLTGSSGGFSQPPSPGAYQPKATGPCFSLNFGPLEFNPSGSAFVMKLNPSGSAITGLTYLGSPCFASGAAIAVDSAGAPWIVGAGSPNFPLAIPLEVQASGGGFISKFNPDLTQLPFSTRFDTVNGLAINAHDMAYVVGARTGADPTLPSKAYLALIDPAPVAVSLDNILSASPFPTSTGGETLAPGKVIRVVGRGIGPVAWTSGIINSGVIAATVAEVELTFDGVAAPLLYVSSTEIGCIVSFAISGRSTTILQVTYNRVASNAIPIPLHATSPEVLGVFNGDFTPNSASNPAHAGSIVTLYLTGAGQTVPASIDGEVYVPPLPKPANAIEIEGEGRLAIRSMGQPMGSQTGSCRSIFERPSDHRRSRTDSRYRWAKVRPTSFSTSDDPHCDGAGSGMTRSFGLAERTIKGSGL